MTPRLVEVVCMADLVWVTASVLNGVFVAALVMESTGGYYRIVCPYTSPYMRVR
jgi:hypothetical protein